MTDWAEVFGDALNPLWRPPPPPGEKKDTNSLETANKAPDLRSAPTERTRAKPKMKSPRRTGRWEWRVRYRRAGWTQAQVRYFQRRFAALRLRDKLLSGDGRYAPIVELAVQRRRVSEWETDW